MPEETKDLVGKVVEFLFDEGNNSPIYSRTKVKGVVVSGKKEYDDYFVYMEKIIQHSPMSIPSFIGSDHYAIRSISNIRVIDISIREYQQLIDKAYSKRNSLFPPIRFSLWNPDGSVRQDL